MADVSGEKTGIVKRPDSGSWFVTARCHKDGDKAWLEGKIWELMPTTWLHASPIRSFRDVPASAVGTEWMGIFNDLDAGKHLYVRMEIIGPGGQVKSDGDFIVREPWENNWDATPEEVFRLFNLPDLPDLPDEDSGVPEMPASPAGVSS